MAAIARLVAAMDACAMALNAGLRAWHARRRKERQTAVQRINARLDTAGIPEDKRAAVSDAYGHYLAASAGGTYAPTRYRDDAPPAAVWRHQRPGRGLVRVCASGRLRVILARHRGARGPPSDRRGQLRPIDWCASVSGRSVRPGQLRRAFRRVLMLQCGREGNFWNSSG